MISGPLVRKFLRSLVSVNRGRCCLRAVSCFSCLCLPTHLPLRCASSPPSAESFLLPNFRTVRSHCNSLFCAFLPRCRSGHGLVFVATATQYQRKKTRTREYSTCASNHRDHLSQDRCTSSLCVFDDTAFRLLQILDGILQDIGIARFRQSRDNLLHTPQLSGERLV